MGFLDIFKKKTKNEEILQPVMQKRDEKPYNITYNCTVDGRLVVELYDKVYEKGKFYNTTKLVIDNKPRILSRYFVQNCFVSWYNEDDAHYIDPQMKRYERRNNFQNILAQIDTNLLQTDENYCIKVMSDLLKKDRIENLLQMGLEDEPERVCGKYIGGIIQEKNGYRRSFDLAIGAASHNSPEMVQARRERKEKIRARTQEQIEELQTKIKKLQQENDEWQQ